MRAAGLTIVVPTRDRVPLLTRCLRSLFQQQPRRPRVIVSDNSVHDDPAMSALRREYPFQYVRQSGRLGITAHHNRCLAMPETRWVLLLHDDDELCPGALPTLEASVAECDPAGIVVFGQQHIDGAGVVRGAWVPHDAGTFSGEEALLRLALDWGGFPTATVVGVSECAALGGFLDFEGRPGDYALACRLAYRFGAKLVPELVGRYRRGHEQVSDFSSQERLESWLDFGVAMSHDVRAIGCPTAAANAIVDYLTWWPFFELATRWLETDPAFVFRLAAKYRRLSPRNGEWQARVRREFPFLFWRPLWLAPRLFRRLAPFRDMSDSARLLRVHPLLFRRPQGIAWLLFRIKRRAGRLAGRGAWLG